MQLLEETEKAVGDPQLPVQHHSLIMKSHEMKRFERVSNCFIDIECFHNYTCLESNNNFYGTCVNPRPLKAIKDLLIS